MKHLIAISLFILGIAIGAARPADAGHEKPCITVTPSRTPTKTATIKTYPGQVCADVVGKTCVPTKVTPRAK